MIQISYTCVRIEYHYEALCIKLCLKHLKVQEIFNMHTKSPGQWL